MTKSDDILNFAKKLKLKVIYDPKKRSGFIEDNTISNNGLIFRELDNQDTEDFIIDIFFQDYNYLPSENSLNNIKRLLVYSAKKNGKTEEIHKRVVKKNDSIFILIGKGLILKITTEKVGYVNIAPVKFEINNLVGNKIKPDLENGDIKLLRKYIVVPNNDFKLILVFIFNCFFTDTHYLMLVLTGPAGSAKSFITKVLKTIIDPSIVMLRNQFTKVEDLALAALHCHLIDINNVSRLSNPIQDTLCTILTSGASTSRKKFTNKGESVIHTHNPVIVNGIGYIITRDDIYERSLIVHLKKIDGSKITPISEKQLTEEFYNDLPKIMGGVFNALSDILFEVQQLEVPDKLNRMADFHLLGLATEKALRWKEGSFTESYNLNIAQAQIDVLEGSKVAQALINLKSHKASSFEGTYKQLGEKLANFGNVGAIEPRKLSSDIDRISSALLNQHNIKVTRLKRKGPGNFLRITFS